MVQQYLKSLFHVLDYGFVFYRKHFLQIFTLTAMLLLAPILGAWFLYVGLSWLTDSTVVRVLYFIGLFFIGWTWLVYSVLVLTHACQLLLKGEEVHYRSVIKVKIGRFILALIFATLFAGVVFFLSYISSLYSSFFLLFLIGAGTSIFIPNLGSSSTNILQVAVISGMTTAGVEFMVALTTLSGGLMLSLLYFMQAWADKQFNVSQSINTSFGIYFYRFSTNIQIWCLSAVIYYIVNYVFIFALLILNISLESLLSSGASELVTYILIGTYIGLLIMLLPLAIIWMSQLYLHNIKQNHGQELEQRINTWIGAPIPQAVSSN